ncbi:hypothetical protein [Maribacter sp. 2304DJ31-5]|uniref:hypothetical protein n=1 Tax=Maribacter sp. 2304DJ31-5 TaxID=3386273 RepID=UPI0039BC6897
MKLTKMPINTHIEVILFLKGKSPMFHKETLIQDKTGSLKDDEPNSKITNSVKIYNDTGIQYIF